MIVQKFGGSSLADIPKLHAACDLIARTRQSGCQLVVVVSAMAKATEQLLELARQAGVAPGGVEHVPRRELDMLVSTGERVSMALTSIALQARGIDAVSLTGSQSGIITDERHFDARILEIRPERITEQLARGRVVIVAGYQGMSRGREITTLGRGGSDTTAVALAAVLGAERCEIYSDVDGVYTADPRVVPDARHLPEIGAGMMQVMAERGAKVLNVRAVEWARLHAVPVVARRTADFAAAAPNPRETRLTEFDGDACAVVAEERLLLVRAPLEAEAALEQALAEWDLAAADRCREDDQLVLGFSLLNVPDLDVLHERIRDACATATIDADWSLVSAVGPPSHIEARQAEALAVLGPHTLLSFRGPLRLSSVVPRRLLAEAQRAWHATFVSSDSIRAA